MKEDRLPFRPLSSRQQWGAVLVRYQWPRLVRFACRELGGDDADAEDLVVTVVVAIIDGRIATRFHLPATVDHATAYTYGLIKNYARNERTAARRRAALTLAAGGEIVGRSPCDPLAHMQSLETGRAVVRALEALAVREREFAALHWLEGWTVPEIAEALGLAPRTVKETLRRARRKLIVSLQHERADM